MVGASSHSGVSQSDVRTIHPREIDFCFSYALLPDAFHRGLPAEAAESRRSAAAKNKSHSVSVTVP